MNITASIPEQAIPSTTDAIEVPGTTATTTASAPASTKRKTPAAKPVASKAVAPKATIAKPTAKSTPRTVKPAKAIPPVVVSEIPAVAEKPAVEIKAKKQTPKKPKLVRDSFTFPESDYALLAELKQRALGAGHEVKKSELLRAGLKVLASMTESNLLTALSEVERIKTGRPSK
ncbi:MAG: hypothetical protein P4L87_17280 [Formivibrio sp.]|nr:hypothetical protein [Formivibrio sp.]